VPKRSLTVSGLPGAGTTTLCRLLQDQTGLSYTYAGAIFRAEADRRGMTLAEFGALSQDDPRVDRGLDAQQIELLRGGGVLLEGRLSGWLAHREALPALKVWLDCKEGVRHRRIVEREGGDLALHVGATLERERSEADRYMRYYEIDLADMAPYDLVLDSTDTPPEALAAAVADAWSAAQEQDA
jgi:predicted cytidylate kinase